MASFLQPGFLKTGGTATVKPALQALHILCWQLSWMVLSAAVMGLMDGRRWAYSILAGAGIGLLTTAYLLFVMIKHSLMPTKSATLFSVLFAWLIKTILAVGLLMVALRSRMLLPLAVILGLSGSLLAYWLSLMVGRVKYANGNDDK